ncbi:phosphinothricin acetyltransferase [Neisseria sp. HSC-16F19]|nr:GNAT family N-acetyltransferase [Neisseria sp. HSC-16F19]MCP2040732.1 phosphinothricin acetyltransferase [Neisseria sp. HSC-16F19]
MNPPYTLRTARPGDLPAIVAIYNSTIASRQVTADLQPVTVAERQAWFDAHSGHRPLYVVENEARQVVAWGSFSDYYPRAAYRICAEISIYLDPQYRGAGLGRQLLDAMMSRAPALGLQRLIAVIFAHNTPSVRLFERAGFEHWGLLPQVCDLDGALADIVLLGKKV